MPISTFNQAPYFDDYNVEDKNDNNKTVVDKNYLRILFQPGFAVQTRELNQLQSSLQNQIEQLGNHFFTEGSAIFGDDKPIFNDGLHYVDIIPNSAAPTGLVDLLKLQGKITDIGTEATVVNVEAFTENNVDKIRLYVTYDQGGEFEVPDADDGLNSPLGNDALYFVEGEYVDSLNTVNEFAGHVGIIDATGYGFSFSIRENVYYTNGSFVHFPDTSLFLRKAEGEIVKSELRFIVSENKVNSTQDSTLLDNANGSSNFSAPGADRYQIVLRPIIVVPNDENGVALRNLNGGANSTIVFLEDDSNIGVTKRLLTVGEGGVKEESTNAFNDFDKKAAKRTAEESGNYVLQPFRITYENFIREENPAINGYYTEPFIIEQSPFGISTAEDARQHYIVEVNTSIAYVNGFRYTYPPKVILKGVRARTFETITDGLELSMNYGHYVEVDRVDSPSPTLTFTTDQIANIKSVTEIGTTQRIHTFQNEDVGQTLDNVSNPTLLFKLPFPGVKSVGGFEYERVSRFTNVTIQETNKLIINSSGGNFSETSAISTPAYGVFDALGKLLNPSYDFTILVSESTASTVKLQLTNPSRFSSPFTILAPEDVKDVIARTKIAQSGTTAVNVQSTSEETILTLTNSDVIFSEDKVNLTIETGTPPENVSGAKFRVIDDGQKKDRYVQPVIGISGLSSTGNHTVKYDYFSHTSGDYFIADSYKNAYAAEGQYGDYSTIPTLDFLENTSLADVIDFRIKEEPDDQEINENIEQVIPRPNSTAKITNLEAWESRIDKLIINDGVDPDNIIVTGHLDHDILYDIFANKKKDKLRKNLYSKYSLNPNKPMILIGVPQLLEHFMMPAEEHWTFQETLCKESTKTNSNILLSLHPKMRYNDYKFLQNKYQVKIISEKITEILPLSDIYLGIHGSSTIPLALLCEIPIIILDPVELNYTIYDWIKSKFVIKDLSNLFSTLNTLINDKKILKEIKLAHKSQKNSVSPFDGKCQDRIFNI